MSDMLQQLFDFGKPLVLGYFAVQVILIVAILIFIWPMLRKLRRDFMED